jgi:hypothetical protein
MFFSLTHHKNGVSHGIGWWFVPVFGTWDRSERIFPEFCVEIFDPIVPELLGSGWWFGTFGLFFPIILGISSSQLTNSIIFQRGRAQPPSS